MVSRIIRFGWPEFLFPNLDALADWRSDKDDSESSEDVRLGSYTAYHNDSRLSPFASGTVSVSSGRSSDRIIDAGFLPEWMYYYPTFIHKEKLELDIQDILKDFSSNASLKSIFPSWKDNENSTTLRTLDWSVEMVPGIADFGVKKLKGLTETTANRANEIRRIYSREDLLARLTESRVPEKAKKRIIEISSRDLDCVLICGLTSPFNDRSRYLNFFNRHETCESFFGERADRIGNIWETEFHMSFHQLHSKGKERTTRGPFRSKRMPSVLESARVRFIAPVAMGFRFVGDLRDQYWTCNVLSSIEEHAADLSVIDQYIYEFSGDQLYHKKQAQRKVVELTYVGNIMTAMQRSFDGILKHFQKDFETADPDNISFDFADSFSPLQYHLRAGEILREIIQQLNFSLKTYEQWENREQARSLRSRWSRKDEERYGAHLDFLAQKCQLLVQQIRVQQSRLNEQRKFTEQQFTSLVSYNQLREAHTSTRSAENVRLFTYVTIIFLPLTFSASLFSMQGAPAHSTVSIMIQTTIIALIITVLVLSNMKALDRGRTFWVNKLTVMVAKKMKTSKHSQRSPWDRRTEQLEKAALRRERRSGFEKHLPAESLWWYPLFCLQILYRAPREYVYDGICAWREQRKFSMQVLRKAAIAMCLAPTFTLVCSVEIMVYGLVDLYLLIMNALRGRPVTAMGGSHIKPKPLERWNKSSGRHLSGLSVNDWTHSVSLHHDDNIYHGLRPSLLDSILQRISAAAESTPRPIQDYINTIAAKRNRRREFDWLNDTYSSESSGSDRDDMSSLDSIAWLRDDKDGIYEKDDLPDDTSADRSKSNAESSPADDIGKSNEVGSNGETPTEKPQRRWKILPSKLKGSHSSV